MFNKLFDHTLLKAEATRAQIEKLCKEAREYDFATVCVNSCYAAYAKELLEGTDVGVCCVVGFPLGAMISEAKAYEATKAIEAGAREIDMVINIGALKDNDLDYVTEDIRKVKEACGDNTLKVIIECCLLNEEEIVKACECSLKANADFVKTSTGFSKYGARKEDVALMRKTVGDKCKVKAAGGIHSLAEVEEMVEAGADRIGASASVLIYDEYKAKN